MKKANNILEISLLLCFIVVVSVVAFKMYNNQKINLANMSKPTINNQSVGVSSSTQVSQSNGTATYGQIETAGTNALAYIGMSASEFNSAVMTITSSKLSDSVAQNADKNIFTLANSLISQLNLQYAKVSAKEIDSNTISTLVGVLNNAVSTATSNDASVAEKATANDYINQFKSLIH